MKRILVLDANQRSSLAVTRSLGGKKVPLITADETADSLAGSSRYSQQYFSYPSPQTQPDLFCTHIEKLCAQHSIDIVMPMTELTSLLLLQHKQKFATLPFSDIDTIEQLANKCLLMQLAESLDIPTPKTWYANDPEKLPVDLEQLRYPIILKPGKSWLKYQGEWIHTTVQIAKNATDASTILNSDPAFRAHPFMLQEFIPGNGGGVFALYDNGKPLAFFAHRRLREKPPSGGVSVLSESCALDTTLEIYAKKLLGHVKWHGVAMVEFRITPEGKPYLMEINTRFWGSLQLAIDAGVNFPWLLYQITCRQAVSPVSNYKIGVRLRWMLGNVDWLYLIFRDNKHSIKRKLVAATEFLWPSPFKTRYEVIRYSDMKPFFWELKQYIKNLKG